MYIYILIEYNILIYIVFIYNEIYIYIFMLFNFRKKREIFCFMIIWNYLEGYYVE